MGLLLPKPRAATHRAECTCTGIYGTEGLTNITERLPWHCYQSIASYYYPAHNAVARPCDARVHTVSIPYPVKHVQPKQRCPCPAISAATRHARHAPIALLFYGSCSIYSESCSASTRSSYDIS